MKYNKQCAIRRIAVVGCGVSGLSAVKACLEEELEPHCFEMSSDIGGVWYTPPGPKVDGVPGMYDSLITNTNKARTNFSDFPCPKDYPMYLPYRLFHQYLLTYAEHFHLLRHVQLNTKVLQVIKSETYDTTGRWVVTTCPVVDGREGEERSSQEYEGVILCQGFYSLPYSPSIPGLSKFPGGVHHVITYRNPEPFRNKSVLVLGGSSSAGDVACDLAPGAKQVYLSLHTGSYVLPRLVNGRDPVDFRRSRLTLGLAPKWLMAKVIASKSDKWINGTTSGLKPKQSLPFAQVNSMINDQLPFKIITGQVKVIACLKRLTEKGEAILEDGSVIEGVDEVIFCTGYKRNLNVIDPAFLSSDPDGDRLDVYKMVFPVSLPHDSLALVGLCRVFGPLPLVMENQARFATRVLAGKLCLPNRPTMKEDVDRMNRKQLAVHGTYKYAFDAHAICEDLASQYGAKPSWWRILLQGDFKLAYAVLCGPLYPYHYRLTGPHPWGGARDATLRAYKETVFACQHRTVWQEEEACQKRNGTLLLKMLACGVVVYLSWFLVGKSWFGW